LPPGFLLDKLTQLAINYVINPLRPAVGRGSLDEINSGIFRLKTLLFCMDYSTEPKGFAGKPKGFVPNIFYDYKGKKWEANRKSKSGKAQ
jgi:hypothetical protein